MDKPPAARVGGSPPAELRLFADGAATDTRAKILDAAFRRLATEGYAALSVREIAKDAGVNHALINYHFRTKDQLVIAVLDAANQRLLARQSAMYQAPSGFAQKWADARRFYESDLGSGFVRVQAELWAASLSNAELRDKFLPRLLAWKQLVHQAVREALAAAKAQGVELPRAFSAEVIACWICEFWLGMEFADLLGVKEEQITHRAALDAVQSLLESLDARVSAAPRRAARKAPAAAPKRATHKAATKRSR
ncbi:MAG TPA: helix-turn-helix domain-containing protein [Burkholderiaceae bacterium]|nr:helix-turn-helix domain-containing protein [Burkholderiaceae bacterium]